MSAPEEESQDIFFFFFSYPCVLEASRGGLIRAGAREGD